MSAGHDRGEHEGHAHDAGKKKPAHDHDGGHAHDHGPKDFGGAFLVGITLQAAFIVAEVIVGLTAHSLAVVADAGHNVSDVLALALAWGATHLGRRKAPKVVRTARARSILTAVVNSVTLVFVNGAIAWEAVGRLRSPKPVAALPVIVVSLVGVGVNSFCAWLFAKGSEGDVNVRAAFLHLASDALVAAGVAITGVLIYYTGILWLDPAASLIVSAVVLLSTWSLLRRALDLAMHAVPRAIDEDAVRRWLPALPGVVGVHDLHVWAMSTTENVLSTHVVVREMPTGPMACEMDAKLREEFAVHHVTIQIDRRASAGILTGSKQNRASCGNLRRALGWPCLVDLVDAARDPDRVCVVMRRADGSPAPGPLDGDRAPPEGASTGSS